MNAPAQRSGEYRVNWMNVSTIISAAILIGAEVFGAAYASGWALGILFNLGDYGVYALQTIFILGGLFVMFAFVRGARRAEPFWTRG
jgi:hypothetical protein